MDESDVLSARYEPGFSRVLTSWEVFIDRRRWLGQKVVVYDAESAYHNRVLWFYTRLSRAQMAGLWEIVERVRFRDFNRNYSHQTMSVDDCPSYSITVRFRDRLKEVEAYDMCRLAEFERQPAVIGFRELWNAITAHAPFEKVPIERGLPRPWWRFW